MKPVTFLNYTEDSFTDWSKYGAAYGYIAFDSELDLVVKTWDWEGYEVNLEQAEKDLNELGYTLGLGGF